VVWYASNTIARSAAFGVVTPLQINERRTVRLALNLLF
jgi:hypothetical protein